jgi:hypothetical protein
MGGFKRPKQLIISKSSDLTYLKVMFNTTAKSKKSIFILVSIKFPMDIFENILKF